VKATPALERAIQAAGRAVELDPQNVRGLQAQMSALYYDKQVDAALKLGERAIAINPNDPELVGQYGLHLALSGSWKHGGELIQSVIDRYPGQFGPYETALALCDYMQRDYATAAALIRKANVAANPMYHLVAAAVYGQNGDAEAATAERDWLMKNAPKLLVNVDREMAIRNVRPEDQAHFVEGLRKAGIPVVGF
jgi:tetratricopeptide (TPR) repeat protein